MAADYFSPAYEVIRNPTRCTVCRVCEKQCANGVHRYDEKVGVMLADVVNALVLWSQGIQQRLTLGGAGLVDSVVISGILAVLLAEAVGEILERIQRGKKPDPHPTTGKERAQ